MKKYSLGMFWSAFFLLFCINANASIISDFSWIPSGTNNIASTTLPDGTVVTLESSPIPFDDFVFGSARVFSLTDSRPAIITLSFSRSIADLRLLIGDLDSSVPETLSGFSTVPTSVDGFLSLNSGVVSSSQDNKGGNLVWDDLNASFITFTYTRCAGCGLFLEELEIAAVPLPASFWLFGSGLVALAGMRMRNKKNRS